MFLPLLEEYYSRRLTSLDLKRLKKFSREARERERERERESERINGSNIRKKKEIVKKNTWKRRAEKKERREKEKCVVKKGKGERVHALKRY